MQASRQVYGVTDCNARSKPGRIEKMKVVTYDLKFLIPFSTDVIDLGIGTCTGLVVGLISAKVGKGALAVVGGGLRVLQGPIS
jgi:hypothetical protein